jgi:hypothetical protein
VEIPYGVEVIGKRAFSGCTSLSMVEIPSSVMMIGENAFEGCTSLPESVINIISSKSDYSCDENYDDNDYDDYHVCDDKPTYEKYRGSYAQDILGWSDDDIDTVLDGDPDAYWNID